MFPKMPSVLKWVLSCETEIYEQIYSNIICHLDKTLVCIFFVFFFFEAHKYFMLTDKL